MFNLFNIGYLGTTFDVGVTGTFKRVLDPINSGETTSKYYVRVNKILTNSEDAILVKAAFEQNIFKKMIYSTPPIYYYIFFINFEKNKF